MKQTPAIMLGALACVAGTAGLAISQPMPGSPGMTMGTKAALSDPEFVRVIQQANDAEIASARYVLRYSKNATVRAFATQMIGDHSTSDVALQTAARNAHVPVPARETGGPPDASLQGLTEPALDAAYMRQQVMSHETALGIVTSESTSGGNAELRQFASNQIPVVKAHLDKAQNYVAGMPARPNASSSVDPISPGGVQLPGAGQGSIIAPPSAAPSASSSPNPQPSVGIPGTLPSPGPSSSPH